MRDLNCIHPHTGVNHIIEIITIFNFRTETFYIQATSNNKESNNREELYLEGSEEPFHDRQKPC